LLSKAAGFLVRPPLPPPAAASCGRLFLWDLPRKTVIGQTGPGGASC